VGNPKFLPNQRESGLPHRAETAEAGAWARASRRPLRQTAVGRLLLGAVLALGNLHVAASPGTDDASGFLTFESIGDGRCLNLSEGGKLRILRNTHGERAIHYRVQRLFAGNHPQGLATGIAPPNGDPVPLGCTRVDGRPQDWTVERARFE
jgi:hypothetical protein